MYTASIQENMQVWKILVFSHEAAKDEAVDLPVIGCIRELESSARQSYQKHGFKEQLNPFISRPWWIMLKTLPILPYSFIPGPTK